MIQYIANHGLGDGVREAALLNSRHYGEKIRMVVEAEPNDHAAQMWENLRFVESVERVPRGVWLQQPISYRADLGCPEALYELRRTWERPLWLSSSELRLQRLPKHLPSLPREYLVVQPSTSTFKQRRLEPFYHQIPAVLVGTEEDSHVSWHGGSWFVDLRGKTSVAETMRIIAGAKAVIGVESWVPLLGALFGKPGWQLISKRAARDLAPYWNVMFPSIGYRISEDAG